ATIEVGDVQRFTDVFRLRPTKRKRDDAAPATLSPGTVRHHLNALSSLYERAQSQGKVPRGYNPVSSMIDKSAGSPAEAKWRSSKKPRYCWSPLAPTCRSRADIALGTLYIRWSPSSCSPADEKQRYWGWR